MQLNAPPWEFMPDSFYCDNAPAPHLMIALLVSAIRWHYSYPDYFFLPSLKQYVWKEDDHESAIEIAPTFNWAPDTANRRPAIFVSRSAVTSAPLGINHGQVAPDAYGIISKGQVLIANISFSDLETELLSYETRNFIYGFIPVMEDDFKLSFGLSLGSVSPPELIKEPVDHWRTVINLPFHFEEQFDLRQDSAPIRNAILKEDIQ